jgi:myosin heavy subunit
MAENGVKLGCEKFNYLRNETNSYTVKAINDQTNFEEILDSIKVLGFT